MMRCENGEFQGIVEFSEKVDLRPYLLVTGMFKAAVLSLGEGSEDL